MDGTIANATADEAEWEYEYDEDETDDFYFTLTLSKPQPEAATGAPHPKGNGRADPKKGQHESNSAARPITQLQVLDLHTESPLIKVEDEVYQCHWSTDLGTQFYIGKLGLVEQPQRRGYVLDVLGTSRARLIGQSQRVLPVGNDTAEKTLGTSTEDAIAVEEADGGRAESVTSPSTVRPVTGSLNNTQEARFAEVREKAEDSAVKAQASFLERLSAIKRKKGETDIVPLYGVKYVGLPDNMAEIRKRALAADAEEAAASGEWFEPAKPAKRPYNKRLTSNASGMDGGDGTGKKKRAKSSVGSARPSLQIENTPGQGPVVEASATPTASAQQVHASPFGGTELSKAQPMASETRGGAVIEAETEAIQYEPEPIQYETMDVDSVEPS